MENDFVLDEAGLGLINRFTRRAVTEGEVYAFPVVLCDNEIDRDGERFSVGALEKLAEMFVGKTGIFDHNPKGENQTARIYSCEVRTDEGRVTLSGEPYTYLYARAYMMRTEGNRDLITEIDGGIKKEVSVSCSVAKKVCSVCGADRRESGCGHIKGRSYGGKICADILDDPTDAYEWSFVAVPAQAEAGVTKRFSEDCSDAELKALKREAMILREENERACDMLRREIISLSFFTKPIMAAEAVKALVDRLSFAELEAMRDKFRALSVQSEDESRELFGGTADAEASVSNSQFTMRS
jgi:hypothetical protein